jgi:hypothetical protein
MRVLDIAGDFEGDTQNSNKVEKAIGFIIQKKKGKRHTNDTNDLFFNQPPPSSSR